MQAFHFTATDGLEFAFEALELRGREILPGSTSDGLDTDVKANPSNHGIRNLEGACPMMFREGCCRRTLRSEGLWCPLERSWGILLLGASQS